MQEERLGATVALLEEYCDAKKLKLKIVEMMLNGSGFRDIAGVFTLVPQQ